MSDLLRDYGISELKSPYNLVIIGDFLKDLDDEHSLCGVAGLIKLGLVNLKCVIGNLAPAQLRARGAKGTLVELGLDNVPVGVGTPVFEGKTYPYETSVPYIASILDVCPVGEDLLFDVLNNCEDKSVIMILQSGMTDGAQFLNKYQDLFVAKIHHVAIMGGVEVLNGEVAIYDDLMVPNNANNNSFDPESANWLYRKLQQVGVPLVITTREVAYAAKVPFSAYDVFEKTGNPVGFCLKNRQMPSMQHLWEAACSPAGSEIRGTLPDDRNRSWFVKVFCAGIEPKIVDGDNIWPYVDCFNLYDPSNIYAAIPELEERFLSPKTINIGEVQHKVFGVSAKVNGVKNAEEFARFMVDIEVLGLQK